MDKEAAKADWREVWQETREAEKVDRNMLMLKDKMVRLLMDESIGGNAGKIEIDGEYFPQAAANGLVDAETGEIIVFGNPQDTRDQEREKTEEFAFVVAVDDSRCHSFFRITFCRKNDSLFSESALRVLAKTIERYNRENETKNNADLIAMVKNFDELYFALNKIGGLHGSEKFYDAKKLIELINAARQKPCAVNEMRITRTLGLRDKVLDLLRPKK